MDEIQVEFRRLEAVYARLERNLNRQAPAADEEIASIAAITGIEVDESLKALWSISNGSAGTMWFAEGEDITPYSFLSVAEALNWWRDSSSHEWLEDESEWGERDSRIQKHIFDHRAWLPFADLNGGSHVLYFDAAPTTDGIKGQIINFIHDPDFVYWRSTNFLEFFRRSNDRLEEGLSDPAALRDQMWLFWD